MSLLDNLFVWHRCDEASGNLLDTHENVLHLTEFNTVGAATGKIGGARQCVAANSERFVSFDASFEVGTEENFAFAFWVNIQTLIHNTGFIVRATNHFAPGSTEYIAYMANNGGTWELRWKVSDGVVAPEAAKAGLTTNTWLFCYVERNLALGQLRCSINNGSFGTATFGNGTPPLTGSLFEIGHTVSGYSDCTFDLIGYWRGRVLSSAEIALLYNFGAGIDYDFVVGRRLTLFGNDDRRVTFKGNDAKRLSIVGNDGRRPVLRGQ